jgi:SAM-dependent methyltransferase
MGEIIPRPVPPVPLPFTGERLTSDYGGQTQIEHMHRYLVAREWCRGKDVLDVASGEGYGTAMLAQVARTAVGVDLAADAVAHATGAYVADNLRFLTGDARALPADDAAFDIVVSFETIEHFREQTQFLEEVRRVLRPGGLFIVSTPDRDNYSPAETPANPYHAQELTGTEFETLLRPHFTSISMLMQRPIFGSVLMPTEGTNVTPLCFERRGDHHFEGSVGLSRPQYLIAFASDNPAAELPPSVYIETGRLGMMSPPEAEAQRHGVELQLHKVEVRLHEAEQDLTRMAAERDNARAQLEARDIEARKQAAEIEACRAELASARGEARGLLVASERAEQACTTMRAELAAANRCTAEAQVSLQHSEQATRIALADSEGRVRQLQEEAKQLRDHAILADARADAFGASTSWRLTAPVRAMSRIILRKS